MSFHICKNTSIWSLLSKQAATRLLQNDLDVVLHSPSYQRSHRRCSSIGHACFLGLCTAGSTQRSARMKIAVESSRGSISRHITQPSLAGRLYHKQPSATYTLQLPPCQCQPLLCQNVFTCIKFNSERLSTHIQATSCFTHFAGSGHEIKYVQLSSTRGQRPRRMHQQTQHFLREVHAIWSSTHLTLKSCLRSQHVSRWSLLYCATDVLKQAFVVQSTTCIRPWNFALCTVVAKLCNCG